MKKILLLSFVFVFSMAWAQDRIVTGKVTSAEDGTALPGVNVVLKGTSIGVISDVEGRYSLSVPPSSTVIVFSFIGLKTQEIEIGGRSVIDLQLEIDVAQLGEVVVTGTAPGVTTKKLTFAVGSVSEKILKEAPGVTPGQALQGKIAGVNVVQSGSPGSAPDIRIRGSKAISGSSAPLVLIDGVISENGLADINSEDIEKIEVVRGSAASSLYGSRAANGVVQVITKRGKNIASGTVSVVVRNEVGANYLPKNIDVAHYSPYKLAPDGSLPFGSGTLNDDGVQDTPLPRFNDLQKAIFRNGVFYTNYASVTGNNKNTGFVFSVQNLKQPGVIEKKDGYNRQNIRLNIDQKISEKITLTTSNLLTFSTNDQVTGNPFFTSLQLRPDVDLYAPNTEDGSPYVWRPDVTAQDYNPLYNLSNQKQTEKRNRYLGNLELKYQIADWISLDGFVGLDRSNTNNETYIPKGYLSADAGNNKLVGNLYLANSTSNSINARTNIILNHSFGDFNVSGRLAYWYESLKYTSFSAQGRGFTVANVPSLSNTTDSKIINSTPLQETNSENYFAIASADWKSRILIDGLYRRDYSSLFGENKRANDFYRLSGAVRLTEFFSIPKVQELKLRASYGTAGVRPQFDAQYETYTLSGGVTSKNTLGNKDLKTAVSKEVEVGLNVAFLDRFSAEVNYASSVVDDQIIRVPLPAAAGFSAQWKNAGSMEYKTVEFTLNADVVSNSNFSWSTNVNFSTIRQKITNLPVPRFDAFVGNNGQVPFQIAEGQPLGTVFGTKWLTEVNDQVLIGRPGATLENYAINDQGYVVEKATLNTPNERPVKLLNANGLTDFVKIMDPQANFRLGFSNTFTFFKRLSVYGLLDWQNGGHVYNATKQYLFRSQRAGDQDQVGVANPKGVNYFQDFYAANDPSSYFVESSSFLKLRELSVNYTFDTSKMGGFGKVCKEVKVGVVGRNLFMITNYSGYDPEVAHGGTDSNPDRTTYSYDAFGYPNFRTFTGSLQLKF